MRARGALLGLFLCSIPPSQADAATFDLSGLWSYSITDNWVNGICEQGQDTSGTLAIAQTGDSFELTMNDGVVCDPAWTCVFSGSVSDDYYMASNSGVVDSEGGMVTNALTFTASSATEATGSQTSNYTLDTFSCDWGFSISMTRTGDPPDGGAGAGQDGGAGGGGSSGDGSEPGCYGCKGAATAGPWALIALAALPLLRRRRP